MTNKAFKDTNIYQTYNISDGWNEDAGIGVKDHDCRKITEYGENGYGFSMEIINPTIKANGGMYIHTNGGSYNKIYFDCTGNGSLQANEVISATQKWCIDKSKQA